MLQHTWVPGEGRIFPLTLPTSLQRAANWNWTGRVDIAAVKEKEGDREEGGGSGGWEWVVG